MSLSVDELLALASLLGALGSAIVFLWRIFKMVKAFITEQEEIKAVVNTIKAEVTHNGGKSIKDVVTKLDKTCERVEIRQKILDQRFKSFLHYSDQLLFEIDKTGNLTWANEAFYQSTTTCGDISDGMDWVSIVGEESRDEFLKELNSCLLMGRRLDIEVDCSKGDKVLHLTGHPYRIDNSTHEGFLIQIKNGE